jgi:D-alanyl-lipoteichoic acid acyltransferase DltB (MBOAT superfamily)
MARHSGFIIWGALHGIALGIDKAIKEYVHIPKEPSDKVLWCAIHFPLRLLLLDIFPRG